jgi:Mg2+ and Co2+ transporter CorA
MSSPVAIKETTMPVGKARAATTDDAVEDFRFVVPCLTSIDEARIRDHLERDHSTVSNRQNDVMKQLTVIATIFLPLAFITGFFGQNFSFMVTHVINSAWSFWVIGLGSMVLTCVALLVFFHRKGWI